MEQYLELVLDGVSGETLGVTLTTPPKITLAAERGEWVDVAGRDGALWRGDHVLQNVPLEMGIYIHPHSDINAVGAWLLQARTLRIAPWDFFWRIDAPQEQAAALSLWNGWTDEGYEMQLRISAQPYRYKCPEITERVYSAHGLIANPCTAPSAPLIRVVGSGDINLMIGRYTVLIDDLNGTILIDCEQKIAYDAGQTRSLSGMISVIGGDDGIARWPRLMPGDNDVSWTGNVSQIGITPRWRWR